MAQCQERRLPPRREKTHEAGAAALAQCAASMPCVCGGHAENKNPAAKRSQPGNVLTPSFRFLKITVKTCDIQFVLRPFAALTA